VKYLDYQKKIQEQYLLQIVILSITERVILYLVAYSFGVNLSTMVGTSLLPPQTADATSFMLAFKHKVDERDVRYKLAHCSKHREYLYQVIFNNFFIIFPYIFNLML
jgi:hypothetical protein